MMSGPGIFARLLRRERALRREVSRLRASAAASADAHAREIAELRARATPDDSG
jgi:hypothetical protein